MDNQKHDKNKNVSDANVKHTDQDNVVMNVSCDVTLKDKLSTISANESIGVNKP